MEAISAGQQQDDRSSRNSESLQTERFKMLEITRDKPIKVAVKVAVPIRDHPKFNFVGKLLGPKGNSMKRLQEDTMCKMAILGRGSMRDRKKEDELRASGEPRYAHLGEDLHVEISTFAPPAEAHARIAYALAEVRRFLVPDYHDEIRQEQMWEMQAITSSSQTGEQSSSPNSLTDLDATNMDCSNNDIENKQVNDIGGTLDTTASSISILTTPEHQSDNSILTTTGLHTNKNLQSAVAAALHQQLGLGVLKTAIAPISAGHTQTSIGIPSEAETTATQLQLLEPHGALLRGVKTVNLAAGSLARKRPLLGVPRNSMNPTKRTVMTLLARAKNSQAIHAIRSGPTALHEPLQMLTATSPLLMSHHALQHHHHPRMDGASLAAVVAAQKESLSQGV